MNRPTILDLFQQSLDLTKQLLADVPDERWAEQPHGLPNHPAWTVAHLCTGLGLLIHLLGGESLTPADWPDRYGPGTQPTADLAAYPPREELLSVLERSHARVAELLPGVPEERFADPPPEPLRAFAPTLGHIVTYLLLCHGPTHNGQLTAWGRVSGYQAIT